MALSNNFEQAKQKKQLKALKLFVINSIIIMELLKYFRKKNS